MSIHIEEIPDGILALLKRCKCKQCGRDLELVRDVEEYEYVPLSIYNSVFSATLERCDEPDPDAWKLSCHHCGVDADNFDVLTPDELQDLADWVDEQLFDV
jgi:hypothetical protein